MNLPDISCRWRSVARKRAWLLVVVWFLGMALPAEAIHWGAKLRGKLSLAALLGAIAFLTEWRMHQDRLEADAARGRLGWPLGAYEWREGFDRFRLECYTGGYLLQRNGAMEAVCLRPDAHGLR